MPGENEKNHENKIIMGMKIFIRKCCYMTAVYWHCSTRTWSWYFRYKYSVSLLIKAAVKMNRLHPKVTQKKYCKTFLRSDSLNIRPDLVTDGYLKHAEVTWGTI